MMGKVRTQIIIKTLVMTILGRGTRRTHETMLVHQRKPCWYTKGSNISITKADIVV